jgi:hypothetical protein
MAFGFIARILDRAAVFFGGIRDKITGLGGFLAGIGGRVAQKFPPVRSKTGDVFKSNPKTLIIGGGGAAAVLVVCIIVALILNLRNGSRPAEPSITELFGSSLPPEELFLPGEPDFLPPVLLERERREAWTLEDAVPYWTDPLDEGRDRYEGIAGRVVDGIMERVP